MDGVAKNSDLKRGAEVAIDVVNRGANCDEGEEKSVTRRQSFIISPYYISILVYEVRYARLAKSMLARTKPRPG